VQRYLRANINIGRGCAITARESIIKSGARKTTKGSFSNRLFSLRQITRLESECFCIILGRTACSTLTSSFHFIHFYILQGQFYADTHSSRAARSTRTNRHVLKNNTPLKLLRRFFLGTCRCIQRRIACDCARQKKK
jgi:hypothetical protein